MKVVFWVRTGNKYGGFEKFIALFAELCKVRGHEFTLLSEIENTSKVFIDRLSSSNAKTFVVGESLKSPIATYHKAVNFLKKVQPDIVNLHFINSSAIPLMKSVGIPLIYQTYHSCINHSISLRTKILRGIDNSFADRIFAVSNQIKQDQIRAGIKEELIEIVPLGVYMPDFEGENKILKDNYPPYWDSKDYKKIITIGRFYPVKGMRFVVEAAICVLQKRENVVWWLVGKDGPESIVCRQMIADAGLSNKIIFLGERNDVPALISQSEFPVIGSLSEGLGLMVLEASACGIPTIGTRVGGLCEVIIDGKTGILVESGSSQALANATIRLLDNPQEKERYGHKAKQHLMDKFNSEKQINQLLDIYEKDYRKKLLND